jgi:hypothetical protein
MNNKIIEKNDNELNNLLKSDSLNTELIFQLSKTIDQQIIQYLKD